MQKRKNKKNKKFRIIKIAISAVFVAFLLLVPFLIQKILVVRNIECKTQYGRCPKELEAESWKLEARDLYSVKKEINKRLKDNFLISGYSTHFKLPNKIYLDILLKKTYFSLKPQGDDVYLGVSEDGRVLNRDSSSSLPLVADIRNNYNVGDKVEEKDMFSLKLMQGVFTMYGVREGKITSQGLEVELPGPVRVIFPLEGEKDVLLGSLRLIYTKAQDISQIDLRFANPILR